MDNRHDKDAERFILFMSAVSVQIAMSILEAELVVIVLAQFFAYFGVRLHALSLMRVVALDIGEVIHRKERERDFFRVVS